MNDTTATRSDAELTASQKSTSRLAAGSFMIMMFFLINTPKLGGIVDVIFYIPCMLGFFYWLPREAIRDILKRKFKRFVVQAGWVMAAALIISGAVAGAESMTALEILAMITKYLLISHGVILTGFLVITHFEDEAKNIQPKAGE
jgi:hypothetical protein